MRSKQLKQEILRMSEGILSTITDLLLWQIIYLGESATTFSRNTWDARVKADRFLEEIKYETIKRAIQSARDHGWIKRARKKRVWPEITAAGKERLSSLISKYDRKRVWEQKFYLITYDIPESRKKERELLRGYLKRIGAGMIQESVWLTPYDPNDILREFTKERKLKGSIIVSDLGKDGSIGEEDIKDLVRRIYKLNEINKEYKEFLEKFAGTQTIPLQTPFAYWKILKNDPQLPFELLPGDWLGERAYQLFLKSQKN